MRSVNKYARGQIWYVKSSVKETGSIQDKNRPYVIVSNGMCNANSPVLTMVPCTTQEKTPLPTHVVFNYNGLKSTVLCEQITSVSILDIDHYFGACSNEIMSEINDALCVQLDIKHRNTDMRTMTSQIDEYLTKRIDELMSDRSIDDLKAMFEKLVDKKLKDTSEKRINEASAKLVEEVRADAPSLEQTKTITTNTNATPVAQEKRMSDYKTLSELEADRNAHTKQRTEWTTNLQKRFVEDCAALSMDEITKKYGIKKQSIYAYKAKFKRTLMQNENV